MQNKMADLKRTPQLIAKAKKLRKKGLTFRAIAKKLKISSGSIAKIFYERASIVLLFLLLINIVSASILSKQPQTPQIENYSSIINELNPQAQQENLSSAEKEAIRLRNNFLVEQKRGFHPENLTYEEYTQQQEAINNQGLQFEDINPFAVAIVLIILGVIIYFIIKNISFEGSGV